MIFACVFLCVVFYLLEYMCVYVLSFNGCYIMPLIPQDKKVLSICLSFLCVFVLLFKPCCLMRPSIKFKARTLVNTQCVLQPVYFCSLQRVATCQFIGSSFETHLIFPYNDKGYYQSWLIEPYFSNLLKSAFKSNSNCLAVVRSSLV